MARFFRICAFVATILHLSSAQECGEYTPALLSSRIVNGELAVQGEFPWQVSIQRRARARVQIGIIPGHNPWDPSSSHQIHQQPILPTDPITQWPSTEEILDSTLWGKYFWAKLTPQNLTYMDAGSPWPANWPPPLPTHGPDNTIPPLPTHPPSHTQFPPLPPMPTFPPSGQWPPVNNPPSGWPPAIPGIPPNGQWPPPIPTHPPSHFPPMPTFPPTRPPNRPPGIPSYPPHIPSQPSRPPQIPSIPSYPPSHPPSYPPSHPPSYPPSYPPSHPPATQPPTDDIHGGPNDPMQPVLPFPTRPPTHQPQPPQQPFPPIPSRPKPPQHPQPPQQPQPRPPVQPPPSNPGQSPPRPPPQNPNEKWQHFCGGSIIDRQWILTAAHCIQPMGATFQPGQLRIVAGSVDWRNYDPNNAQVISVDRIAYHTSWTQQAGQHDVALLHLAQPLTYVKKDKIYVNRVCLSNQISSEHTGMTTSSGWGFLNKDQRQTPDALRKVDLPIIDHEQCRNAFSRVIGISQMQVCAGQSPKGNCMGDSGSPLVQKVSDRKVVQLGIVSFSIPCATPGYPDVFTRVSKYLDWIMSNTGLSLQQLIN